MSNVKSFKVCCLSLTDKKTRNLAEMVNEYAEVYNFASKYIPSLDKEKYLSHTNPSELYTKWIKSKIITRKYIQSIDAFNAIKDAVSNYKACLSSGKDFKTLEMKTPNIIKFENRRYTLIKHKDNHAIVVGSGEHRLFLPLVTGNWTELIEHLNKCISEGTNPGSILYNLKDNSVSIPTKTEQKKKFNKKKDIETIIGIDRGLNNHVVLCAIDKNKVVLAVKLFDGRQDYDRKRRMKNVLDKKKSYRNRKSYYIQQNNNVSNYTNTLTDVISKQIVDFVTRFPNPLVVWEKLDMDKKKLRNKHGGKATKSVRKMISKWTYGSIKTKSEYKLKSKGIYGIEVQPYGTSQLCHRCGAIGVRDGIHFKCEKCGLGIGSNPVSIVGQYNADVNASINIALRGFYVLYERKKGNVLEPKVQPDRNDRNAIPTQMSVVDGKDACISKELPKEPTLSTGILGQNEQSTVNLHREDCVPENGISFCYKAFDKNTGRTELGSKTDIGGVL